MYYVTMTDKFMSGWGHADRLTNKLVFECETMDQAQIVADNAENRSDQNYINICLNRPSYYRSTMGEAYQVGHRYVQNKNIADYPSWYKAGYFS